MPSNFYDLLRMHRRADIAGAQYRLGRFLRTAIFRPSCVICGNAGGALCVECLPAVGRVHDARVLGEHRPVGVLGAYRGNFAKAVKLFKAGRRDVGDVFIREMALRFDCRLGHDAAEARAAQDLVLIGVPTTAARRRERGFDGGHFLARGIALALDLPVQNCLRRLSEDTQRGKSRAERLAGRNRFALHGRPPRRQCALLIDDVVTTGATLRDIARVLRENGTHVLGALAAAYVP